MESVYPQALASDTYITTTVTFISKIVFFVHRTYVNLLTNFITKMIGLLLY